ncbi:MAG: ABC transporter substrate-binding protein [Rhodoferax sp.]|uniref:ABC transporter substrate-binding protein n=1 Tax=Rhodoferax sp. TaxID=50421 RepID=UPI0014009DFA|nr:NrtA/SsuA/CpmA family ABC transporter substrate-binding protein [Rhodoferax sp.]NDP37867.1 ABC transporter substrate-binding protein [Rhodoferax sp.]
MKIASKGGDRWRSNMRIVLLALSALAVGVVAFLAFRSPVTPTMAGTKVSIAVPMQINSALILVASGQGLFRKAGVDVASQPLELGKDALKAVLDGEADLAVVADTPVMFALLGGADIAMLAGISQSRRALAIIAHSDRGINKIEDLKSKSIGLTQGTNLTYFLDAMLQVHGVPSDGVTAIDLRTDAAISAFKDGRLDAAVVYQPFLGELQSEMGNRIKVFYGEDVYAFRFILVGKPSYIDSHPQEVRAVLRALIAANQAIRTNPVEARRLVGDVLNIDDATMAKIFEPEDYAISLDQAMLLALDDQTRWAMKKGLAETRPMPNYMNYMKYQDLEAVLPTAVTIVH